MIWVLIETKVNPYRAKIFDLKMLSAHYACYACCKNSEANTVNSDLGSYCLQYRLTKVHKQIPFSRQS